MSFDGTYNFLAKISVVSVIIPLVTYFIRRRALNRTLKILCFYLFICLVSDIMNMIYSAQDTIQYKVVNTFTILECSVMCIIYYLESENNKLRYVLIFTFFIFSILAAIQFVLLNKFSEVDVNVSSLEAGILILFSGLYLVKLLMTPEIKKLENYYFFWIVLSNTFYFGTALVFFLAAKFIKKAPANVSDFLWGFQDSINILCYLLFTVGICQPQKK